MEGTKEK